jgi:hypothetical protein
MKKKQEIKQEKTITAHEKAFKAAEKKTRLQLAQVPCHRTLVLEANIGCLAFDSCKLILGFFVIVYESCIMQCLPCFSRKRQLRYSFGFLDSAEV